MRPGHGVGAARYLTGALEAFDPATVTAVVNVGDDVVLHALHVSPDLDTRTYTLAGAIDPDRGWGLVDETWKAMAELGRHGADWFSLGDRDQGATCTSQQGSTTGPRSPRSRQRSSPPGISAAPCSAPTTGSKQGLIADGREVGFQEYFVGMQHSVEVTDVRFAGAETATLSPPWPPPCTTLMRW